MSYFYDRFKDITGQHNDKSKREEDCYTCKMVTGSIFTVGGLSLFLLGVSARNLVEWVTKLTSLTEIGSQSIPHGGWPIWDVFFGCGWLPTLYRATNSGIPKKINAVLSRTLAGLSLSI